MISTVVEIDSDWIRQWVFSTVKIPTVIDFDSNHFFNENDICIAIRPFVLILLVFSYRIF
jgi:hypothetical protein